ncbi:disks large-associated protein 1-like, partial [Harpegnathos saltator]
RLKLELSRRIYSPVSSSNTSAAATTTIEKKPTAQIHAKPNVRTGITKVTQKRLAEKATKTIKQTSVSVKDLRTSPKAGTIKADKVNTKECLHSFDSTAPANFKFNLSTLSVTNVFTSSTPNGPLFGKTSIEEIKLSPKSDTFEYEETTGHLNTDVGSITIETIKLQVSSDEQKILDSSREKQSSLTKSSWSRDTSNTKSHQSSQVSSFTSFVVTVVEKDNAKGTLPVSTDVVKDDVRGEQEASPSNDQSSGSADLSLSRDVQPADVLTEKQKHTVQHFKQQLQLETERLQQLCQRWTEVQSQDDTTEEAQQLINQEIGQTSLLINEKFQQFRDLLTKCETGSSNLPINCTDLQGFWDLTYIEVKDCDSRFARLERLRAARWREKEPKPAKSRKEIVAKKSRKFAKKKTAPVRHSTLRELISAERRKKRAEMQNKQGKTAMSDPGRSWTRWISASRTIRGSRAYLKEV